MSIKLDSLPSLQRKPRSSAPDRAEVKVVYLDNGTERVLRGTIVQEDRNFIHLERRDGQIRIAKRIVLRVESWIGDRSGHK